MESTSIYTEEIKDGECVMTVHEYLSSVEHNFLIDYDGNGHPAREGRMAPTIVLMPSKVDDIPTDATHIVWFNR